MTKSPDEEEQANKGLASLPTLEYFQRTYSKSMEGADQKAVGVFKDYETAEKTRRLQNELMWIKDGKVSESTCNRIIGKKRKSKYQSYNRWAELMLIWLATHKK